MNKVYVAGSINMDVVVTATRYPTIGETVPGTEVNFFPGGKGANQAVAAAKLGAPTTLIGLVGKDSFGAELRTFLASQGINLGQVRNTSEAHTGTAVITIVDANNAIVVVPGANALISKPDVLATSFTAQDVLVSQFEIPLAIIKEFFLSGRSAGSKTVLNPAPAIEFDRDLLRLVDVLVLNESELSFLTNRVLYDKDPVSHFIEAARSLRVDINQVICVTLGARGAVALVGDETIAVAGRAVKAVDTTGAGDCFVGAIAACMAAGENTRHAIEYANDAASLCVQRMGAGPSMPMKSEVEALRSKERCVMWSG